MDALYHKTNKTLEEIKDCFVKIERNLATGNTVPIENEIQDKLNEVSASFERLDIYVNKEPPTRRQNAKYRVDELKYESMHLQTALQNLQRKRMAKEREIIEREELLQRKFAPNNQDTSILIDQSLQFHNRAQNAHRNMDEMIGSGNNILGNLREQRMTLKGTHRKIMDVANTLGMSNTVMRIIEKRTYQDKFILFGGMIVTCIVMVLVVVYLT